MPQLPAAAVEGGGGGGVVVVQFLVLVAACRRRRPAGAAGKDDAVADSDRGASCANAATRFSEPQAAIYLLSMMITGTLLACDDDEVDDARPVTGSRRAPL